MKISQAVEFFITGLDKRSEKQELVPFGKGNSLGTEDMLAKIFNFGNDGAYMSVIKGENKTEYKFHLGIPKHKTNFNQKAQIENFFSELIQLKESSTTITKENIGYSLFVTKNVHLKEFYSVLNKEKQKFQDDLDQNQRSLINFSIGISKILPKIFF